MTIELMTFNNQYVFSLTLRGVGCYLCFNNILWDERWGKSGNFKCTESVANESVIFVIEMTKNEDGLELIGFSVDLSFDSLWCFVGHSKFPMWLDLELRHLMYVECRAYDDSWKKDPAATFDRVEVRF